MIGRHFTGREAVFFDFDGVLVDSMQVKTRAFARLYEEEHPAIIEGVIAYHRANGGVSRFKKFEHYERVFLGREPSAARLAELGARFAALVVEEVVACPEIVGAGALLECLRAARTPCYVVSGTPEEELRVIVERRGMASYFCDVRGSPAEKAEIMADLLRARRHRADHCLMVGDALGDFSAAQSVGMNFLGVVGSGDASPFPAVIPVVHAFAADVRLEGVG